jgi:hypothetical protein
LDKEYSEKEAKGPAWGSFQELFSPMPILMFHEFHANFFLFHLHCWWAMLTILSWV